MSLIAAVYISETTRKFDKEYHYAVPFSLAEKVKPGIRVMVPFGRSNRTVEAYITSILEKSEFHELKEISKILDEQPLIDEKMIGLALWMKERYICTFSDALKCMMPPGTSAKTVKTVRLIANSTDTTTSIRKILDVLEQQNGLCEYEKLKELAGGKSFSKYIKKLSENGILEVTESFSTGVREKVQKVAYLAVPREEATSDIENNRIKKIQHIRILEMLLEDEYIPTADIIRFSGVSAGVLNTLEKNGYIEFKEVEVFRDPLGNRHFEKTFPLTPTIEQAEVLAHLKNVLSEGTFKEILLHGVTGSGKTEVYLQLIQHCFDLGRQAIVLVPEISLTPQMVERFRGRFGDSVAVIHSRLSIGERFDQWRLIKEGKIRVVVGARSAVFAPLKKPGLIIIDEEQEGSYKSEITPKYHARDLARERCIRENALLLLGSATPSVETYFRAVHKDIGLLEMHVRANNAPLPEVELVDMRSELDNGNRTVFSHRLTEEINKNIQTSQQTMLFMNRRGYSSFVLCRSCGLSIKCLNCNITMTYHSHDDRLICHYCGYTIKNPETCPSCKSSHIRHFGVGTQKIEEEIKKHFEGATVIRMDMDTTTYKNSHEEILSVFKEKNINIMVGTQMIAKGHDFPNVTLVGVIAADSMLNINDFRASEKTFQLLTQVAGRAGRGELTGRVIIQTYNTEDFSIRAACRHDYRSFYSQEIILREKLSYPPFTNIASVIMSGNADKSVFSQSKQVTEQLREKFKVVGCDSEVMGPSRAPLSKIRNKYRWRIIIKCREFDILTKIMTEVSDWFNAERKNSGTDMSVDINPLSML
ncbi:MAG: primosomal protein N' [Bacillota bacterium]|nr:primosomal protein N' [Bacillota bacterium]